MGASKGETCGFCRTPQFQGATICRSCGAERREEQYDIKGDRVEAYVGFFLGCMSCYFIVVELELGWLLGIGAVIVSTIIGLVKSFGGLGTEVKWYR